MRTGWDECSATESSDKRLQEYLATSIFQMFSCTEKNLGIISAGHVAID